MYSLILNSCVKQACTEQTVEIIAARHSLCTIWYWLCSWKNVNIHLKRTLSESSEPSSHMSYPGLLSPLNHYLSQQSIILAEEHRPFEEIPAYFWDKKGCSWVGCMHQMQLLFISGAELSFAGQFRWEYAHFGADLLSPIIDHFSKTNQRIYSNKA